MLTVGLCHFFATLPPSHSRQVSLTVYTGMFIVFVALFIAVETIDPRSEGGTPCSCFEKTQATCVHRRSSSSSFVVASPPCHLSPVVASTWKGENTAEGIGVST